MASDPFVCCLRSEKSDTHAGFLIEGFCVWPRRIEGFRAQDVGLGISSSGFKV